MSIFYEEPQGSALDTFAGGVASLSDIHAAVKDAALYADNAIAKQTALERAYDDRIDAVRGATGIVLDNPMRRDWPEAEELAQQKPDENFFATRQRLFATRLAEIASQHPDARDAIRAEVPIDEDRKALGAAAKKNAERLIASRDGLDTFGAVLTGAVAGGVQDPFFLYSMVAGGGVGAGRTIAGRVLSVATREAIVNGATEAAVQPMVQSWHKEIGLPNGFEEAMKNVAGAALLGGALGGTLGVGGEVVARMKVRAADETLVRLREAKALSPDVERALAEDAEIGAALLDPIRQALPAQARGALDEVALIRHMDGLRPSGTPAERHDLLTAAGDRAVRLDPDQPFALPPDPAQVGRIVDTIVGRPDKATPPGDSLVTFLMRSGGIKDFKGDVEAVSGGDVAQPFVGRLSRPDGLPLDRARELAAEAGYLDRLYGNAEEAMSRSTIADLLDGIDDDLRGRRVYSGLTDQSIRPSPEAERAGAEEMVAEVTSHLGPGVSDELVLRAVRLVQDGSPAFDAAERVLTQEVQNAGDDAPVRFMGDSGEGVPALPGWSDDELEAAMQARGPEPTAGGLDDPASLTDDDLLTPEDYAGLERFPFLDDSGRVIPLEEFLAELDAEDDMARVVAACRT